jgi:predicted TIM-barrel enzyme
MNYFDVFGQKRTVFAMLHLKGTNQQDILERTKREIEIYLSNEINAMIVENYFGSEDDVEEILKFMQKEHPDILYGVNMLNNDARGFEVAGKYGAKFIQLDSVAGHLEPEEDERFGVNISQWRKNTNAAVLGGVRFKYQPYKSGRSLDEDLKFGLQRCDAIVVTGSGTGVETELSKIIEFRSIIGTFPLIVGAGITPENCEERLSIANGAIIGSYFKDTYKDTGELDASHVKKVMGVIKEINKKNSGGG